MQEVIYRMSQAVNLVKVIPAITTVPYTSGSVVGGPQLLSNIVSPRGSGQLHSLTILDKSNQKAPFDILIFDASPDSSTTSDHSTFAFGGTDDLKVIARISVATGDYIEVGGESICQESGLDLSIQAASGFNLYAVPVTSGTPTYAVGALQFVWGTTAS